MGFSKSHQVDSGKESDSQKWVLAGISIWAPLKSISTKRSDGHEADEEDGAGSTTPTARESKIPERLPCPPAPRKRRSTSRCHLNGNREFFNPPDLESVFICHAERAN
ncbi:cyclin-dependent protein kinase inhibitor SMR6-like [Primulina huaijiensis]|uniref:cyclin-dependent protein kinase inhibitor SMR6-like n=1 Tax=Primulina huaijiensis TaxID=1492673 RepID=UPI003CC73CFE